MFRRYCPKGGKLNLESDSVRISNQILAFSSEVWEKCFGKAEKMALFFEQETNQIGLKGDTVNGLAIAKAESGDYKIVRWNGFIKSIKFNYESPVIRKIVKQGFLWVIEKEKMEVSTLADDKNIPVDFQDASNH
jgi:hypothetical protein